MATIGSLGKIAFKVSSKQIITLKNFKRNGSARYSTHQRINNSALTEFTGNDPERITFDIILSASCGTNPQTVINQIEDYKSKGKILAFVLGGKPYGKYRWVIVSYNVTVETFDGKGNILNAIVSITLDEYLKN
jgi:phage protein U